MKHSERYRLLHGPYQTPRLRKGDRTTCLLRDGEVVVTSWTDARISWPRCRALGHRGGSGILLEEELARAVRSESAAAVCFWWGVTEGVVWRWRKTLGVTRTSNEGSRRLIQAAADAGARAIQAREFTKEERDAQSERSKRLGLGRFLQTGYHGPRWTEEQLALLGTMPDDELARRIGRSVDAVRCMRTRLGIATALNRRR